jgi:putative transposase
MAAHIELVLNPKRAKKRLPPIKVPSKGRFFKAIEQFDQFEKIANREGIDEARRSMHAYGEGVQDVERALQEVEIDHWNVQLRTILTKARIWHRLDRKSRRRLEKVRMILGAAICRRTRVVVGMVLSRTPSVEAAIRLIEMVVSDKRRFAEAAGCMTPYDIAGVPELILFDGGPAFNNSEIASVLRDLNVDWGIAPAGLPHLRGMVERLFGMIDEQAISWFEGRTFSDIRTRGDYDPDLRTDTSVEELGRVLVRYVVDRHHNKPRQHLGGEAPRECYMTLSKKVAVWGPPDATKRRNVFGVDVKRVVGPGGIRFLNIQYRSAVLHAHFMKYGGVSMTCRVHAANLGAISVRMGKKWWTVPGPAEFDGVDAETWIAAEAAIRAKMQTTERTITAPIVNAALLDVARLGDDARKRARIDDSPLPRRVLNWHEAQMRVYANFPEDRQPEPASNQDIYATAVKVGRGGAGKPSDANDAGERENLPGAEHRTARPGMSRGGRRAEPAAKSAKAPRKPASKPAKSLAPRCKGPTSPERRPGLKRTFTAKD